jgi:beta-lactam-binding protein with PASTA domain
VALVDKDGIERRALAPSDINLGTSGIRLAKPGGLEGEKDVTVPDVVGKSRAAARLAVETAGLVFAAGNDDGTVESQSPPAGSVVAKSSTLSVVIKRGPQAPAEHQVVLARTTSLDDPSQRAALRTLLMALQNAVGDGDASHIALSVQVVVTRDVKDDLLTKAQSAGINPRVTDL